MKLRTVLVSLVLLTFRTGIASGDINPEEVANLVYFLATDSESFITGGLYLVNGGLTVGWHIKRKDNL